MSSCTVPEARYCLRVAIALTCAGVAAQLLMYGGPVLTWLWLDQDWSEPAALRVEHAAAYALLASIPFLFWRKGWAVAKLVAGWLLVSALAETLTGTWHPELTPGGHAARYLAPLALAAFSLETPRERLGEWLLRVGAGATFLFHGIEALLGKAEFVDYLISAGDTLFAVNLSESTARTTLGIIGVLDVLAGVAILLPKRLRAVACWMALWGFVTALARVVYLGWGNWPELLIRVTNGAVPLTLVILWAKGQRRETTE
ncbi:MAG: hypothetical protein K8I27_15075 [Planctomycetes bacterium]|nr:hypothetical protein [Planctomycetota bacterium]